MIGDVKKGNASADHCGTDELPKHAKNEEWHVEFCLFKQQTQDKFEEKVEEIHALEQLIRNTDKNQQDQTKKLTSNTLEALKKLTETQAEMGRLVTRIHENSSGMKEAIEQLRTEQERHSQILERMNDEIRAIKRVLEKMQQISQQVSQETRLTRLEPIQVQMIIIQLKEALQNIHS